MLLHERWFVDGERYPVQFDAAFTSATWFPLGVAVGVTSIATVLWRVRGRRPFVPGPLELGMTWERYQRLLSWMPLVIGLHAAVALALTWATGAIIFGPVQLLEQAMLLGIAFFLFTTGRGPLAFDMALERLHKPLERFMPYAVPVLRVLTGVSIAVVAFTEKLWDIPMGLAFLADHHFNFFIARCLRDRRSGVPAHRRHGGADARPAADRGRLHPADYPCDVGALQPHPAIPRMA